MCCTLLKIEEKPHWGRLVAGPEPPEQWDVGQHLPSAPALQKCSENAQSIHHPSHM